MYKAVLRDTGQEVAIKVQRPNVEPIIFRDLFIFRQLVRPACVSLYCSSLGVCVLLLSAYLGNQHSSCCLHSIAEAIGIDSAA